MKWSGECQEMQQQFGVKRYSSVGGMNARAK